MSRLHLNDGDSGLNYRNKLNTNFIGLYSSSSIFAVDSSSYTAFVNKSNYFSGSQNISGSLTVGDDIGSLIIDSSGNLTLSGSATTWNDLKFPPQLSKLGTLDKPDFDLTNGGLLFPVNDQSEFIMMFGQFPHERKDSSDIYPHIHYIQDQLEIPTFILEYRWYNNGEPVPTFTTIETTGVGVFTYPGSGSFLQITPFPSIDGTGKLLSSIIDMRVRRKTGDISGSSDDVLYKEFDMHYEIDGIGGSSGTFTK